MKVIIASALASCLFISSSYGESDFSNVGKALDAVMHHHFANHAPSKPFSIGRSTLSWETEYKPIRKELQDSILKRIGKNVKYFVPISDLRLPREGEMDPARPKGTYRGIENKKEPGQSVEVFSFDGIGYVDSNTIEVYWRAYRGPLGARGGAYIVKISKTGFTITKGKGGWTS